MTAPEILVSLYPPPVRERWGNELADEVAASGPRSWLDTAAGAARLWAHPSDWPESITGQTRRILLVELFAVLMTAGLLLRAAGRPSATFAASITHPAASAWLLAILLGLAIATPLPPLRWAAMRHLTVVCLRTLAAPALMLLALYAVARVAPIHHPLGATTEILLRLYYWSTLAFAGLRSCALAARAGQIARAPSARRLRLAALLVGTGLALAAAQNLESGLDRGLTVSTAGLSIGLAAIAIAALTTAYDLRRLPQAQSMAAPRP